MPLAGMFGRSSTEAVGMPAALVRAPEKIEGSNLDDLSARSGDLKSAFPGIRRGGAGSQGMDFIEPSGGVRGMSDRHFICGNLKTFNWKDLDGRVLKVKVNRGPGYEIVSLVDEAGKKEFVIKAGPNPEEAP